MRKYMYKVYHDFEPRNTFEMGYKEYTDNRIIPDEIVPNLYLGNTFSRYRENLKIMGIENVVTANEEPHDPMINNIVLSWNDDVDQNIFPQILRAYEFIDQHLSQGEKVLVHCFAGVSRSATVVTYYLMRKFNIPFEKAYGLVKSKRPIVQINPGFEAQLKSLSNRL